MRHLYHEREKRHHRHHRCPVRADENQRAGEIKRTIPLIPSRIYAHILAVNTYLYTQRERLSLIEKRGLYHLMEDPIMEQCVYQLQRLGVWSNHYQAEFYAGAVTHVLRVWARSNFAESPEEITRIIYSLLNHEQMKNP